MLTTPRRSPPQQNPSVIWFAHRLVISIRVDHVREAMRSIDEVKADPELMRTVQATCAAAGVAW